MKKPILLFSTLICMAISLQAQLTKLTPGNPSGQKTNFGRALAAQKNVVVIGAPDDDEAGNKLGAVYIFEQNGATWSQTAKIVAPSNDPKKQFGDGVAISGNTVAIASFDSFGGRVYIYKKNGGTWSQVQVISPSPEVPSFGSALVMSDDLLIIGAKGESPNSQLVNAGAVYVYKTSGQDYSQQAKFSSPNAAFNGFFGNSISYDDKTLLVGAPAENNFIGNAYIFNYDGSTWSPGIQLTPPAQLESLDKFGGSVAINGNTAVIGTIGGDDSGNDSGEAYIYTRNNNVWTQSQKIIASDGDGGDGFATSVVSVGDYIIVGASQDETNGSFSGSVYLFQNNGSVYTQEMIIYSPDPNANELFGLKMTSSNTGNVFISATGDDANPDKVGAVFVLELNVAGIKEAQHLASQLQLFPNPARENLQVQWHHPDGTSDSQNLDARIIDMSGKAVWNGTINPSGDLIPVRELNGGNYILELQYGAVRFGRHFIKK